MSIKNTPYKRIDIKYEILNKDWYESKHYYKKYDFSKHKYSQLPFTKINENLDKRLESLQKRIDKIKSLKCDLNKFNIKE